MNNEWKPNLVISIKLISLFLSLCTQATVSLPLPQKRKSAKNLGRKNAGNFELSVAWFLIKLLNWERRIFAFAGHGKIWVRKKRKKESYCDFCWKLSITWINCCLNHFKWANRAWKNQTLNIEGEVKDNSCNASF